MKILIGCECSGVVRNAFRKLGHDAWSCDTTSGMGLTFILSCDRIFML